MLREPKHLPQNPAQPKPRPHKERPLHFALVVGTPPTMMAYATGYFQAQDIFKRGIILDILGVALLSFGIIWLWRLLGLVVF
jgi:sulfite exporter TauE/SafE